MEQTAPILHDLRLRCVNSFIRLSLAVGELQEGRCSGAGRAGVTDGCRMRRGDGRGQEPRAGQPASAARGAVHGLLQVTDLSGPQGFPCL